MRRRKLRSTAASIGEIGEDVASYMYNEMINDMLHCLDERFAEHSRPLYLALGTLQPKLPQGIIILDSLIEPSSNLYMKSTNI